MWKTHIIGCLFFEILISQQKKILRELEATTAGPNFHVPYVDKEINATKWEMVFNWNEFCTTYTEDIFVWMNVESTVYIFHVEPSDWELV